jgi:hypothetical protein
MPLPVAIVTFEPAHQATVAAGSPIRVLAAGPRPSSPTPEEIASKVSLLDGIGANVSAQKQPNATTNRLTIDVILQSALAPGRYSLRLTGGIPPGYLAGSGTFPSDEGWLGAEFTISGATDGALN